MSADDKTLGEWYMMENWFLDAVGWNVKRVLSAISEPVHNLHRISDDEVLSAVRDLDTDVYRTIESASYLMDHWL